MLASQSEDAIPMLVDQGDADQSRRAVRACGAGGSGAPEGLAADAAHSTGIRPSHYFMASFIEDHLRFHAEHLFRCSAFAR